MRMVTRWLTGTGLLLVLCFRAAAGQNQPEMVPFHGTLVTVSSQTFRLALRTAKRQRLTLNLPRDILVVERNGCAMPLSDAIAGDTVSGAYYPKNKLVAWWRLTAPRDRAAELKAGREMCVSGEVTAVDPTKREVVVTGLNRERYEFGVLPFTEICDGREIRRWQEMTGDCRANYGDCWH